MEAPTKAITSSSQSRLGTCEVCKHANAKYTCPACEVTSCSLVCSKKHKVDKSCDGMRKKTAFVRLKNLDTLHLTSDYRLIEDITRKVDICKGSKDTNSHRVHNQIPAHLHRLKQAVLARESHLLLLPNKFSRRKANTTMYDFKLKKIFWKLQLTFLNAQRFTLHEARCPEDTILRAVVEKYLQNSADIPQRVRKTLEAYRRAGLDSLVVLLSAEQVARKNKKFYKLDMNATLQENLVGKTIVEHPQLYICIEEFITTKKAPRECPVDQPEKTEVKKKAPKSKSWLMAGSDNEEADEVTLGIGLTNEDEKLLDISSGSSSLGSEDDDEEDGDYDEEFMEAKNAKLPAYGDLIKH